MGWFHEWWIELGFVGQIMACCAIPMTIVLFLQALLMVFGFGSGIESDSDSDIDFDSDADFDTDYDMDFDADSGVDFDGEFDGGFGAGFDFVDLDGDGIPDVVSAGASAVDGGVNLAGASHFTGNHGNEHQGNGIIKIFTVRGIVAFFAMGGWAGIAALSMGIRSLWAINIALIVGVAALLIASAVIRFALRMQSNGNIDLRNAMSGTAEVYITIPPSRSGVGKITMTLQERFVELEAVTDSESAIKPRMTVEIVGLRDRDCLVVRPCEMQTEY